MMEKGTKRSKTVEERIVIAFRAALRGGADVTELTKELAVSRPTARKYAGILADAHMVQRKSERSDKGRACMRIAARRHVYFAIIMIERELLRLTVCSFYPRDIRVVCVPYNESLTPEDNAQGSARLLRGLCADAGAYRSFVGVIRCDGARMDETVCKAFCADKTLSRAECEHLAERKEKERACAVTEYFCDSVRKARMSDRDAKTWQSMASAERGMIDALLMKIAEDAHRLSLGGSRDAAL